MDPWRVLNYGWDKERQKTLRLEKELDKDAACRRSIQLVL